MFGTVPPVLVMKDLVAARFSLELNNENRLYIGSLTGGHSGINAVNSHALREQVELIHARDRVNRLFEGFFVR